MKIRRPQVIVKSMQGYTFVELLTALVLAGAILSLTFVSIEGRVNALSWVSTALQSRHLATGVSLAVRTQEADITLRPGGVEVTTLEDSRGLGAAQFPAPAGVLPAWATRNNNGELTVYSRPAGIHPALVEKKLLYEE